MAQLGFENFGITTVLPAKDEISRRAAEARTSEIHQTDVETEHNRIILAKNVLRAELGLAPYDLMFPPQTTNEEEMLEFEAKRRKATIELLSEIRSQGASTEGEYLSVEYRCQIDGSFFGRVAVLFSSEVVFVDDAEVAAGLSGQNIYESKRHIALLSHDAPLTYKTSLVDKPGFSLPHASIGGWHDLYSAIVKAQGPRYTRFQA